MKSEDSSRLDEKIDIKDTGTPGVFSQKTFGSAYRNGFEKKREKLLAKKIENQKNN